MKSYAFILIMSTLFNLSYAQNCSDLRGQWQNESGSILQIDSIASSGIIIGVYKSATGVDGKTFSLLGWTNVHPEFPSQPNISFSVRWAGYGSITSWTGYCYSERDEDHIKTMWHLVRSGREFDWERVITNSSTFSSMK